MKRKRTSGEAPAEGGGRARRAAANAAVFFRKNIYIILMILCILAIAAMIVVAAVLGSQPDDMPDTPTIQQPDEDDTPIVTPPEDDDTPVINPDPVPEWTFAPVLPAEQATVIKEHSVDELVFSATENKWKTHIGTDFAAETGSEVKAVFDGTVTAVSSDAYYGGVVEITHENGYVTTCKLLDNVSVAVGDTLKSGDVIGYIADSFYFECADAPHVHVELKVNGEYEDIANYLKEGDK